MIDLLSFLSLQIVSPQTAGTARATAMAARFDMRALSSATQPTAVEVDVPAAHVAGGPAMFVSLAMNGRVIARERLGADKVLRLRGAITAGSILMRNRIEVAVLAPGCDTAACRMAVASVRLRGTPRLVLGAADRTERFAQLATRYRAGMTIRLAQGVDPRFGPLLHHALAPLAPLKADGANLVIISQRTPIGLPAPLHFDAASPSLVRGDGVAIMRAERVSDLTVVQVLRGGPHPVIWVRPGRVLPELMELDDGNVALFGGTGRVLEFMTDTDDRTLRPVYTDGPSAARAARTMAVRRLTLLALWVLGSAGLLFVFRRLPRDPAMNKVPSWAA